MNATANPATASRCAVSASHPSVSWHLDRHLECFWPSRRIDAFDGLCRSC